MAESLFGRLNIDEMIELASDGTLQAIRIVTPELLRSFNPRNPADVAKMSQLWELYSPGSARLQMDRAQRMVQRFNILDTDRAFETETDSMLAEATTDKAMLAASRSSSEGIMTASLAGGKMDQNFVYVNEGPNPCPACLDVNGSEGTYSELSASHLLPGDRCYQGDACQCILIPIDRVSR